MSNNVIPFEMPKSLSTEMADLFGGVKNDLSEGVADSFAVVSFKGKVWRVKWRGEEQIVKNADGDPSASLVAVIVKGSPQISKIYYPGAYNEGDADAPDCFSIDGVKPDPGAANAQAPTCASCPKNIWGSKITEQGNKTKACSDSRRIAIVPYPDLKNESFGGPLLLRVPPASLQELKSYGESLEAVGAPYQAVITKITFDMELAYPKLKFQAIKALTMDEAKVVHEVMNSDVIDRMLAEAPISDEVVTPSEATSAGPAPAPAEVPEEKKSAAVAEATVVPTTESVVIAEVEEKPTPTEKPTPKEANATEAVEVSAELDGLLGSLL